LACLLTALAALAAGQGCSEKAGGTRYPNTPPNTHISKGPSESAPNYYLVQVFWFGTDEDGDVDHYDVAVVKDIRRGEPVLLDSLPWRATATNDSTFLVEADSCCYGEPGGDDPYLAVSYWGIFVRAVDNDGDFDETPASVFFLASNEIPRVALSAPPHAGDGYGLCSRPYFEWEGYDPDGLVTGLEYKYLAITGAMRDAQWEGGLPPYDHAGGAGSAAPEIGTWSRWVPADCTYVEDIDLSAYAAGSEGEDEVTFAVTARDEGGAVLPVELFDSYNEGENLISLTVSPAGCPVAPVIESDMLGLVTAFECTGRPDAPPVIFSGAGIYMRLYADEDRSLSRLASAYRYYFDEPGDPTSSWTQWTQVEPLREAGAEPEWQAVWPPAGPRTEPEVGQHVFRVEVRDRALDTTCAEFHFDVLEGPAGRERNILLVDDDRGRWYEDGSISDYESQEFEMWSDILEGYDWQEWDTGSDFGQPVPASLVGTATTVIWSVDEGSELTPDLLDLCANRGNHLHSYVEAGGNLIVIGRSPVYCTMYWYDRTPDPGTRAGVTYLEFDPRDLDDTRTFGHFMWDVFGIKWMRLDTDPEPDYVTAMTPCAGYGDWTEVRARAGGAIQGWPGYFTGAFLATSMRPGDDVHPFCGIRFVLNPSDPDTAWVGGVDCNKIAAVYVEGGEERGWAAYISLPAWWFEREDIKATMRRLLEMFGE
jgi:hypothetical protein